jgi:hypothetical protein
MGISVKGGAAWGGSISQEVKPEDEMATDSQNGNIIFYKQSFPDCFGICLKNLCEDFLSAPIFLMCF